MRCAPMLGLLLASGCRQLLGFEDVRALDLTPDAPGVCTSFSTLLETCDLRPAGPPLVFEGDDLVFDTATGTLTSPSGDVEVTTEVVELFDGTAVRAIVVSSITIGAVNLRAIGDLAFGLIATDAIRLESTAFVDVSIGGAGARNSCGN